MSFMLFYSIALMSLATPQNQAAVKNTPDKTPTNVAISSSRTKNVPAKSLKDQFFFMILDSTAVVSEDAMEKMYGISVSSSFIWGGFGIALGYSQLQSKTRKDNRYSISLLGTADRNYNPDMPFFMYWKIGIIFNDISIKESEQSTMAGTLPMLKLGIGMGIQLSRDVSFIINTNWHYSGTADETNTDDPNKLLQDKTGNGFTFGIGLSLNF